MTANPCTPPKCHDCGRFMNAMQSGVAWKMCYSGFPPEPAEEIHRCLACVAKLGTFTPQLGIVPEYSCGVVS